MKKSTLRQRNLRLRKELMHWIQHYLKLLKEDPGNPKHLKDLKKVFEEYAVLDSNKGECP